MQKKVDHIQKKMNNIILNLSSSISDIENAPKLAKRNRTR